MKEVSSPFSAVMHYDLAQGELIVGAAAMDWAIEAGYHPADIQQLGHLLTQSDRPVDPDFTEPIGRAEWDPTLDIPTAKWLHSLVQDALPEQKSAISSETLIRASHLGLTPRITYFKTRPGGVQGLYAEAELRDVRMRGYFDTWSSQDYIDYVQSLGKKLKRRPQNDDLAEYALLAGNPSEGQISKHFGKLSTLMELAGWVNVREWDTNDFIDWGVHFMFVNDGLLPTTRHLRYVGSYARSIGPGIDAVAKHDDFSSILDYQTKVADEYMRQKVFQESTEKMLTEQAEIDAQSSQIVRELLEDVHDPREKLLTYARYILVSLTVPDLNAYDLKLTCRIKKPAYFVEKILRSNPELTLGGLETIAAAKGLSNIIWQPDYSNDPLRVASWDQNLN